MKGLAGVLDRFSEGLRIRKILPSLLEEVRLTTTGLNQVSRSHRLDERYTPITLYFA